MIKHISSYLAVLLQSLPILLNDIILPPCHPILGGGCGGYVKCCTGCTRHSVWPQLVTTSAARHSFPESQTRSPRTQVTAHMHAQQCAYLQLIRILQSAVVTLLLISPAYVRCGEPTGRRLQDYVSMSIGACHCIEWLSLL